MLDVSLSQYRSELVRPSSGFADPFPKEHAPFSSSLSVPKILTPQ